MFDPFGGGVFGGMPPFFIIMFLLIIGFIIFVIVSGIKNYHKNATSPILTQYAKIISKRTRVSGGKNSSASTYYYVTFETEAGQRIELKISGREYGLLVEGDHGELTYQGEWYKDFKREI